MILIDGNSNISFDRRNYLLLFPKLFKDSSGFFYYLMSDSICIRISKEELTKIYMVPYKKVVEWSPNNQYFDMHAGAEWYRLLVCIANAFPDESLFIDIGTFHGLSTCALAANNTCKVISYDIYDHITDDPEIFTIKHIPNIEYRLKDCMTDDITLVNASVIVIDVDVRDGLFDAEMLGKLRKLGFKGLLVIDDISLNDSMKALWENIPEKKYDVTKYGHWTGTGIVCFSDRITLDLQ